MTIQLNPSSTFERTGPNYSQRERQNRAGAALPRFQARLYGRAAGSNENRSRRIESPFWAPFIPQYFRPAVPDQQQGDLPLCQIRNDSFS